MTRRDRLDLWFGDEVAGTIHDASPLAFEYSEAWLARPAPMPVAVIPKNLSVFHLPGHGVTLTPFQDSMCTRIYPALSRKCAFSIGGETRPGSVGRAHLTTIAKGLGMRSEFLPRMARDLASRIPAAVERPWKPWRPRCPETPGSWPHDWPGSCCRRRK